MDVKLIMFKENGDRKEFPVRSQRMVIGRKADCDLRVPLADISRQHAELQLGADGVILKDLGSTNGTYVNNKRIKKTRLKPGDYVVFGPVVFVVQIDGKPEEIKPAKTKLARRAATSPVREEAEEMDLALLGDEEETAVQGMLDEGADDVDPISALEALASGDSSVSGTALDIGEDDDLQT